MKYNPNIHHRRSIRLKGYDYSNKGLYFITICCQNRACLFGSIENGNMICNDAGEMIEKEWLKLPQRFTNIALHNCIVMPNHFHAILEIVGATLVVAPNNNDIQNENDIENKNINQNGHRINNENDIENGHGNKNGQPQGFAPTGIVPTGIVPTGKKLGDMVGAFESITTVKYINGVKTKNWKRFDGKLWQRNYWEHIIRNEQSLNTISAYIINNPKNWDNDKLNKTT